MKKNQIILIIIGVLIIVGLISIFVFWLQFVKPEVKEAEEEAKVETEISPPVETPENVTPPEREVEEIKPQGMTEEISTPLEVKILQEK